MNKNFKTTFLYLAMFLLLFSCSNTKEVYVKLFSDFDEISHPTELPLDFKHKRAYLAQNLGTEELLYLTAMGTPPFNKGDILKAVIKPVTIIVGGFTKDIYIPASLIVDEKTKFFAKDAKLYEIIEAKPAEAEKQEKAKKEE